MARLNEPAGATISLFPMFNILVATLGVLVFIMTALATLSLSSGNITIDSVHCDTPDSLCGSNAKKPTYFEWDGSRIVLYPSRVEAVINRDLSSIQTWPETYRYLDRRLGQSALESELSKIRNESDNRYVVFLVRPSGFESFSNLRAYFVTHLGLDIGYEPMLDEWKTIRFR